jgi:malonyl-CoA decarboxylase
MADDRSGGAGRPGGALDDITEAPMPSPAPLADGAPAPGGDGAAPPPPPSTLVGRALGRWRQALREIATVRLPFQGGTDPDLPDDQAGRLAAEMRECLDAPGGEALARAQAAHIASAYLALSRIGRARFFALLAREFGIDRAALEAAIVRYRAAADEPAKLQAERALRRATVSPAMRLLTKFNALPDGLRFLIDMRADLLAVERDPALDALDADFRQLLATWFDVGFLSRRRLTWDSPAALLEKIVEHEAVHEIRSWTDLRHRLDGDRRCYAFFHPSLPGEPLIFLQVALVEGLAGQIEPLLDESLPALEPRQADTAIFYSITSTLPGLRGISFGNFLIKQVVDDLAHDLPNLRHFATLSPLPGFRSWLARQPEADLLDPGERAALAGHGGLEELVGQADPLADAEIAALLAAPLMRAAARYLVERDDGGQPLDPVARFHLGNGARIERLNWAADRSHRRLQQSLGIMVNYLYRRADILNNHEAFARRHLITVAPEIAELLKDVADERRLVRVSRGGSALGRMIRGT